MRHLRRHADALALRGVREKALMTGLQIRLARMLLFQIPHQPLTNILHQIKHMLKPMITAKVRIR